MYGGFGTGYAIRRPVHCAFDILIITRMPNKKRSRNVIHLIARQRFQPKLVMALALVLVSMGGYMLVMKGRAANCAVDAKLVNSCRPWLGAWANDYGKSTWRAHLEDHEARIGRSLDIVHAYHGPGSVTLSTDEKYFVNRAGTMLLLNWKPASTWSAAGGGDATVNAQIDQMADSIKAMAPHKIFLTVFHEPENDVSPGTSSCSGLKGSAGSPAQYRAMWQNTRARFDARGVSNAVWVMNYMGYGPWDCLVPELWPGNNLVDWVMWDPYDTAVSDSWSSSVGRFYNVLSSKSDAAHDYLSKPWGLAEFGVGGSTDQAHAYKYYQDARASLASNAFPKLKAYVAFDALGSLNTRVSYSTSNQYDTAEQDQYRALANDAHLVGAVVSPVGSTPAATPPRPPVSPMSVGAKAVVPTSTPVPSARSSSQPTATQSPSAQASVSTNTEAITVTSAGASGAQAIAVGTVPVVSGTIKLGLPGSHGKVRIMVDGGLASTDGRLDTTYLTNNRHSLVLMGIGANGGQVVAKRDVLVRNHLSSWQTARNQLFLPFHGNKRAIDMAVIISLGLIVALGGVATWGLWRWRFHNVVR